MARARRNANANIPSIETLSIPSPPGFQPPPKNLPRVYGQNGSITNTAATETELEALRKQTDNSEVCDIVNTAIQNSEPDDPLKLALGVLPHTVSQAIQVANATQSNLKTSAQSSTSTKTTTARTKHNGLFDCLPPLSNIHEIFDEITINSRGLGLDEAQEQFLDDDAGIRIVTMCSGTDSPLIALNMVQQSLQRQGQDYFKLHHLASCEIEPYKQAFIERNFGPPIIFRDVTEFTEHKEHPKDPEKLPRNAYGAIAEIPQDVHMLIAGSSCVDHSSLNNNPNKEHGESVQTLLGVANYAAQYRPVVVLLENVALADWAEQHIFWANLGYYFRALKIDSKNFYVPQTRERGYSFAVDKLRVAKIFANRNVNVDELGADQALSEKVDRLCTEFYDQWHACMNALQRRASSPYTDFLLDPDDSRLQTAKAMTEDRKVNRMSTDWKQCRKRHTRVRAHDLLGTKRPFTNRENDGRSKLSDHAWQKWSTGCTTREQDVLDITMLRSVSQRDMDIMSKSRNVDISQNVDRDVDSRAWGLVGCITPMGSLFETRRGGPIVGLETLALQGMPIDNLDLTKASLTQLQNLAGNAMTTTVIGASILSTLIACHKVSTVPIFDDIPAPNISLFQNYTDKHRGESVEKSGPLAYEDVRFTRSFDLEKSERLESLDAGRSTTSTWQSIINAAELSQRLCICENLGQHTMAVVKQCRKCSYTVCDTDNCSRSPHDDFETLDVDHSGRGATGDFISSLTQYLPGIVRFSNGEHSANPFSAVSSTLDEEDAKHLNESLDNQLRFQGIRYGETWKAIYESSTARLELEFTREIQQAPEDQPSRSALPSGFKVRPIWLLFAKCHPETAASHEIRDLFKHPIARMYPEGSCFDGNWEFWKGYKDILNIDIQGGDILKESWEAKLGLQGNIYPKIQIYDQLEVKFSSSVSPDAKALEAIAGVYKLLEKCPSPYGRLYLRESTGNSRSDPVFFYLNANSLQDTHYDRMEFGTRAPNRNSTDDRNLLLRLQDPYRPTVTESEVGLTADKVDGSLASCWTTFKNVSLSSEKVSAKFFVQPKSSVITQFNSCKDARSTVFLAKWKPLEAFHQYPEGKSIRFELENKPGALKDFNWMMTYAITVPQLDEDWQSMRGPAQGRRCAQPVVELEQEPDWDADQGDQFKAICAPKTPTLEWVELAAKGTDKKNKQKLVEDHESAQKYEKAMKKRPAPASAIIHRKAGEICLQIQINVLALMHRAAADLVAPEDELDLKWRLSRHPPFAARPKFVTLKLLSNIGMAPLSDSSLDHLNLWTSQRKTLAWMLERESSKLTWEEEILKESCIPSLGWRLEAKASRKLPVFGGVLADNVGAGKTKTTLALIGLNSPEREQDGNDMFVHREVETHLSTNATLILVPANLMSQWSEEIEAILHDLDVVVIKNARSLKRVSEIKDADIVLAPLSIFEEPSYWEIHRMVACAPNVPEKAGRALDEYLNDSLNNLSSIVGASGDWEDLDGFWDEWSRAKDKIGKYKRFSGVKTRASKKAEYKAKAKRTAAAPPKRAASTSQSASSSPPQKKVKSKATDPSSDEEDSAEAEKGWVDVSSEIFEKGEKASFEEDAKVFEAEGEVKPLLHMFNFRRLVVDEFTYAKPITLSALLRIKATSRWMLSGTPPVHDFDSVNTTAKLLGTKLSMIDEKHGVHGFVKAPTSTNRLKSLSEEFQEHQGIGSPALIQYLYGRAKDFSDEFIRQDDCSEPKKGRTHELCPFKGSLSELLDYAELNQVLEAGDGRFNVTLDAKKFKDKTQKEIRQMIRQSHPGPRAALVASMSDLATSQKHAVDSTTLTSQDVVTTMTEEILQDCRTLLTELQELFYCQDNCYEDASSQSFNAFLNNFYHLAVLDLDLSVAPIIDHLVSYAANHPEQPKAAHISIPAKKPAQAGKEEKKYAGKIGQAQDAFGKLVPWYQSKEMDQRTTGAESLVEGIVGGLRRLRFVRFALEANNEAVGGRCSSCKNVVSPSMGVEDLAASGECGHIIHCANCTGPLLITSASCKDTYCSAPVGQVWSAGFFGPGESVGAGGAGASAATVVARMQKAVDIIQAVPEGEFVLVFVQYGNMTEQFVHVCREHSIAHADATKGVASKATIEKFKAEALGGGRKAAKVLLLQIDSEDAAGWNLQCANHVVFLAPFVGDSVVHAWDTMVQAVGRAHRPGQKRDVVVYHFYGADTIEQGMAEKVVARFQKTA